MTAPTTQQVLAQLTTTREADQRTRLDSLLARATNAARWGLFIAAACACRECQKARCAVYNKAHPRTAEQNAQRRAAARAKRLGLAETA